MSLRGKLLGMLLVCCALGCSSAMAQVVGWRMDGTGKYLDATPPTEWSAETNVVWKTPMPDWSNASPVLVGDRIFVCSEPTTLICVRASDGEILWQRTNTYLDILEPEARDEVQQKLDEVDIENTTKEFRSTEKKLNNAKKKLKKLPEDAEPEERTELEQSIKDFTEQFESLKTKLEPVSEYIIPITHGTNGYSPCTPTSNGENVYVLFVNGVAACYDMEGNRKWIKLVQKPTHGWGHSSSPVLIGDKLLIHIRALFALDKDTGETVWESESEQRWGTAVHTRIGGVDVAIMPNGDFFRVSDGERIANRTSKLDYATPIIHDGIVYFIQHRGKAFRLPLEAADTITPEFLWETKPKKDRYYASSVYHEGLIYAVIQRGHQFSVIDAETGEVVHERKLKIGGGVAYPSITLAGDYLYVSDDYGVTVVLELGREPKEIANNRLEKFRGSPVFAGKRIYVRGMKHLYCIGE